MARRETPIGIGFMIPCPVYVSVIDDRRIALAGSFGTAGAVTAALIITAVAVALGTWRLRRLNIE